MTKEEIASVLAEIDSDLKKAESEAVAALKKADEGASEPEPKEPAAAEDSSSPASPASDAPPSAPSAAGGADAPAGPPDAGAPAGTPPAGDPGQEQGLTPEALQAEYAQLPPEELDMHIQAAMAAKEAMAAAAGPAAGGMPPAGAPPAGPAGAPPAGGMPPEASEPPMPPMGKADLKINKEANGGKITGGVKKSEDDSVQKLTALVKSQQEDIENLTKAIRSVLEAPVRKSVSALSEVGGLKKSEDAPKTRRDVDEFIKANAEKMTKSERDLWLDFVANKVPAAKLAPMLDRLASAK